MPAQDLWDTVQKFAPLSPVRYGFHLHGWNGAPWHVLQFELVEALNLPYRLILELVIDEPRIDLDDLLGDSCTCEFDRDGGDARNVHGLVLSADDLGRVAGRHHIRLEVGPALALLAQSVDTRAWQDTAAPDVIRDVLTSEFARENRSVDMAALALADYPRRDYCVQFRESNLAFVSRLLEEEGITYHFNHRDGPGERLVLTDDNRDFAALQPAPLEIIETDPDTARSESLQRFHWGRRLRSTSVHQRNFDWQSPGAPRTAARPGADLRGRTREVYEHDDIIYPGDGPRHAKLKQERLSLGGRVASGTSNVTRLAPGLWFALQGHARIELDDKYLVTRVVHRGHSPDAAILNHQPSTAPPYTNEFECVPLGEPHRPPRLHAKPRVSGLQTAIVTGPPGEEVHCDEHGRIKVLPHWDRNAPSDDTSSWWVRVTQTFAGPGWGSFFLPRVGMEVVVDFLDGDPDRPLVVGCVYNGTTPPPYPLPAEKTKTTIKSNSSPGGGGSNELRFEDQTGAEEVYLHAQKDWNSVVESNRSLSIGASESNSVGANRTRTVGMNETVTVGMNETLTVGMNITQTCGMNLTRTVGANETVKITKNQDETIDVDQSLTVKGSRSKSVTGAESASVGGARTHSVGEYEQISVQGPQMVTIGDNQVIAVTKNQATTVTENHGLSVTLASAEDIGLGKNLSVGESYRVTAKAMSTTVTEAHIETVGTLRSINAGAAIELSCGAAKIVLETGGKITISGTTFEFSASGPVKINGSIIDLN